MTLFRLILVLFLAVAAGPAGADDGLHVSLATGDSYPPYTDEQLPYGGFATRVVMRVFQIADVRVDSVIWRPWNRVGLLTQELAVDAAFPYIVTPER